MKGSHGLQEFSCCVKETQTNPLDKNNEEIKIPENAKLDSNTNKPHVKTNPGIKNKILVELDLYQENLMADDNPESPTRKTKISTLPIEEAKSKVSRETGNDNATANVKQKKDR